MLTDEQIIELTHDEALIGKLRSNFRKGETRTGTSTRKYRRVPDRDIDDVIQETFLLLLRKKHLYKDPPPTGDPRGWLISWVLNTGALVGRRRTIDLEGLYKEIGRIKLSADLDSPRLTSFDKNIKVDGAKYSFVSLFAQSDGIVYGRNKWLPYRDAAARAELIKELTRLITHQTVSEDYWREYTRTWRETTPFEHNNYKNAERLRTSNSRRTA